MESLVKHFGAGLIAMAVLVAIAVVVIGIVKSDGVTAQFQDTLTAFFTSIRNAAGFQVDLDWSCGKLVWLARIAGKRFFSAVRTGREETVNGKRV